MFDFLKELIEILCWHNWEEWPPGSYGKARCTKCGKIEIRI